MKNSNLIILISTLIGCSTQPSIPETANAKSQQSLFVSIPKNIKLFPPVITAKFESEKSDKAVQEIICDGRKADVRPVVTVIYIPPVNRPGVPLDVVSKRYTSILNEVRECLKSDFLLNAANSEETCKELGKYLFDESLLPNEKNRKAAALWDARAPELQQMVTSFTFMIPFELIDSFGGRDFGETGYNQWGYSYPKRFSPELALENRKYLWRKFMQSQTSVKEAAREDGKTVFQVSLDLDLFCKYGIPNSQLVSR